MKNNQNGFSGFTIVLSLLIGTLIVLVGVYVSRTPEPPKTASQTPSETRDKTRKEHVLSMASGLTVEALLLKKDVALSQAGFDSFARPRDKDLLKDPQTGQPYVFTTDIENMQVGQASFRLNATCDDKIKGSTGTGKIIDSSPASVAVTIKLESGRYACESNL